MISIWNEIVEEGNAFPQVEALKLKTGLDFFKVKVMLELHLTVTRTAYSPSK